MPLPPPADSARPQPSSSSSDDESDLEEIRKLDEARFAEAAALDVAASSAHVTAEDALKASTQDPYNFRGSRDDDEHEDVAMNAAQWNLRKSHPVVGGGRHSTRSRSAAAASDAVAAATPAAAAAEATGVSHCTTLWVTEKQ